MPYIKKERRWDICLKSWQPNADAKHSDYLDIRAIQSAGEMNYAFTEIILSYIRYNGLSYQNINDVIGALEGAKSEFTRRTVVPYENQKIEENGDVP
jgi:hypothetical protein